jgi:hypothetical protein
MNAIWLQSEFTLISDMVLYSLLTFFPLSINTVQVAVLTILRILGPSVGDSGKISKALGKALGTSELREPESATVSVRGAFSTGRLAALSVFCCPHPHNITVATTSMLVIIIFFIAGIGEESRRTRQIIPNRNWFPVGHTQGIQLRKNS